MNAKEFVNYFKGGIELGGINFLDGEKFLKVNEKLSSVADERSIEGSFCTWLKGVFETSEGKVSEKQMVIINQKLEEVLNNNNLKQYYENDVKLPTVWPTSGRKC